MGVSLDGRLVSANLEAAELLGPCQGRALPEVLQLPESALAQLARVEPGQVATLRAVVVRRDDRRVYVDLHVQREGDGGWRATAVDVTRAVALDGEVARLRARLDESERARAKLSTLQTELAEPVPVDTGGAVMIGSSGALKRVRDQIARVAGTNTTVLIHGETGAGKELVARSVHALSTRKGQAFVPVNCGAIPETLIESEMFGHERGAFTGADRRKLGKFELADGGTLFLDEIAELPLQSQAKLLRVLQDGLLERVGGTETVKVNVRLIAATHRDLARQVERGRFREDLFYRLNVFKIEVPPLRARKEDLKVLAEHLHDRVARRMARPVLPLSERSVRRLLSYDWPGNVRELANAVERATLLADGPELEIEPPDSPLSAGSGRAAESAGMGESPQPTDVLLDLTLEQLQRLHITHALERSGHRVFGPGGAAERLEINPRTLLSRMDKYGILRPREARRTSS
jgi:transcriptional regulator with GAF, ATPase, and Fis domain